MRICDRGRCFVLLLVPVLWEVTGAEEIPKYQNLRFEEDWSSYTPASDAPLLDRAKHVELSEDVWLSMGGKIRLRAEGWDNFGFTEGNDDVFLLYRLYLHTDLHLGEHWRVFVEGRFSGLTDRDLPGGKRPALDVDRGDLWNAFVEGRCETGGMDLTVRLGRQELQFGRQRLVSPLDWANNRRIFDAAWLRLRAKESGWTLTAFTAKPVTIRDAWFTWNDTNHDVLFSGLYYTRPLGASGHTIDAYAFASNALRDLPVEEDRYTIGLQAAGPIKGSLIYNIEGAYQFGRRTTARPYSDLREHIQAWMATAETTYTFAQRASKPWLTLGIGYASGDGSPNDGTVHTFQQLYPLGHAYLGYIDALGRQNMIDARLGAGFWPIKERLRVQAELHWFWLANREDGLYNVGGAYARSPIITTEGDRTILPGKRTVGQELDLSAHYFVNRHVTVHGGYSRFFAGSFLETTGAGSNVNFVYAQIEFTF